MRSPVHKDLRSPKYRKRVVQDKRRAAKVKALKKEMQREKE